MRAYSSAFGLVVAAILFNQTNAQDNKTPAASYPPHVAEHLDLSVNPCDDFYKFSCGGWSRRVQIPSDAARFSLFAHSVQDKNRDVLLKMLKSNTPVVSKYFDSCMNTKRINQVASTPLQTAFQQIDAVKDLDDLVKVTGELALVNFNFLVELSVSSDDMQATENVLQMTQASGTLRGRSYYLSGERFAGIQQEYRQYIGTMLTLAQIADSSRLQESVDTIVNLEKFIAKIRWSHLDTMDPVLSYNRMTFEEAAAKYPLVFKGVVTGLFAKAGVRLLDGSQSVIIRTPSYIEQLENLLDSTHLDELKLLMKYLYIHTKQSLLGEKFTAAAFEFLGHKIHGLTERQSREKFCVDYVINQLPNRIGKEYAALMFDTESANLAKDMISRVEASMKRHLVATDWIDNSTRQKALEKLAKVTNLIGHSEEVEQLDEVTLRVRDFFGNTESIQKSLAVQQIQKLFQPVNKREWIMAASEVNAYYNLNQNTVIFPAGILQPPYFSKSYPAAINYGATATSMGHELIHAFDETGRLYDRDGNMVSWWTETTVQEFANRTKCLVDQYSNFEVVSDFNPTVVLGKVDGTTTLDENIADVSGFAIAFEAYQNYMEQIKPQPTEEQQPLPEMDIQVSVDGLPQQQRQRQLNEEPTWTTQGLATKTDLEKLFYVSYAQSWCIVAHDEQANRGSSTHAPNYFRVNGVMMNDRYFGNLFKCSEGTKMNPKDKCTVW